MRHFEHVHYHDWEYAFYSKLQDSGLIDAFRELHPEAKEYSWVGRSNDGYRFDHSFVSPDLLPKLKDCRYLHEEYRIESLVVDQLFRA